MDIVTFFIAGFLLLWVKYADVITQSEKKIDFSKKIKEGFKFIFSSKIIIGVLFVTFLGNLFALPVDSLSVVYFSNFFADKYVYSVFMATIAVGGIFGTWLLTKLKTKMSMNMLLAIGFFVGGLGVSFMFFSNIIIYPIIAGLFLWNFKWFCFYYEWRFITDKYTQRNDGACFQRVSLHYICFRTYRNY